MRTRKRVAAVIASIIGVFTVGAMAADADASVDSAVAHADFRAQHGVVVPRADWANSLAPASTQDAPVVTLAKDYSPEYTILVPAEPSAVEREAATELAHWLRMICGAEFAVVTEEATSPGKPIISVGNTRICKDADFKDADLKQDGYRIDYQKRSKNLFIQGGSRKGVLNGVYALLEEDLGCRWYPLDTTVIPLKTDLQLPVAPRVYVSPFDALRWNTYSDVNNEAWQQRNRGRGLKCLTSWFVHTYQLYVPPKKYFKTHPEYFAVINGKHTASQICPLQADVQKVVLEDIERRLQAKPDVDYVDISQNDSQAYCECPKCAEMIAREGTVMAPMLSLVNFVADNIKEDYPDVRVTTLAYMNTVVPPKTFGPRPNVKIWFCTDRHAWGFGDLFYSETDKSSEAMQAWRKRNAPMLIWDYPSSFSGTPLLFNLPVQAANLRWYIKNGGADGIFFQTRDQDNYAFAQSYLRSWVFAKLGWNPTRDTKALVRDFTYGFYGPAAPQMQAWEEFLWKTWEEWHTAALAAHPAPWNTEEASKKKWSKGVWKEVAEDETFWKAARKYLHAAENALPADSLYRARIEAARLQDMYRTLEKGPQDGKVKAYRGLMDEFERVARAVKFTRVESNLRRPDLNKKLAYWKKLTEPLPEIPYIQFSKTWKFVPDRKDEGLKAGWFKPEMSDLEWQPIQIGDWRKQGYKNDLRIGWYRQRFNATDAMLKRDSLWMLFGGVDETAEVYINGKLAFTHTYKSTGLTPGQIWNRSFVFDARPFIKAGENLLAVRVTRTTSAGGIWRPVGVLLQDEKPNPTKMFDKIEIMNKMKSLRDA